MNWSLEQKQAINSRGHAVVLAGAGSGKTRVIVEWYCKALLEYFPEARIEDVIAVTFTEKAAGELRRRIRDRLRAMRDELVNAHVEKSEYLLKRVHQLDSFLMLAPIGTIHSLCARLLRRFWREARIDPYFRIVDEVTQFELIEQAFEQALQHWQRGTLEHQAMLAALLAIFGSHHRLKREVGEIVRRRSEFLKPLAAFRQSAAADLHAKWAAEAASRAGLLASRLRINLDDGARKLREKLAGKCWDLAHFIENYERTPESSPEKWQAAYAWLDLVFTPDGVPKDEILTALGGKKRIPSEKKLREAHDVLCQLFDETHPEMRRALETGKLISEFLEVVLAGYAEICDGSKNASGHDLLDFAELELRTLRLLENPNVLSILQREIKAVIVDEYQDTSNLQWEIFKRLVTPTTPKNDKAPWLFVVGDPTQAIYGWRQAGHNVFRETITWARQESDKEVIYQLLTNFRTQKPLLDSINQLCSSLFEEPTVDAVSSEKISYQNLTPHRPDEGGRVVWFDYVSSPELAEKATQVNSEEADSGSDQSEASSGEENTDRDEKALHQIRAALQLLEELVGKKAQWQAEGGRTFGWGDVAFLCRKRRYFTAVESVLRERGIPFETHAGSGFYERPEILDVLNGLRVLANTDDSFSLLGFLRGNLVRCPDTTLYKLAQHQGASLWEKCQSAARRSSFAGATHSVIELTSWERERIAFVLDVVERSRRRVGVVAVDQIIEDLLEGTGAWGASAFYDNPKQVRENLKKLVSIARSHCTSNLEAFLDYVDQQEEAEGVEGEAPLVEEGGASVRIMTVHAAKGLEFPIVVLPFLEGQIRARPTGALSDGEEWFCSSQASGSALQMYLAELENQRQVEEEKRVFYVALTRAKDMLILCSSGPQRNSSRPTMRTWLEKHFNFESVESWEELENKLRGKTGNSALKMKICAVPQSQSETEVLSSELDNSSLETLYVSCRKFADQYAAEIATGNDSEENRLLDRPPFASPLAGTVRVFSLGVSEFLTFLQCPVRYYFEYILELPKPYASPARGNSGTQSRTLSASEEGQILHSLIEELLVLRPSAWDGALENKLREKLGHVTDTPLDGETSAQLMSHIQAAFLEGKFSPLLQARRCWFEREFWAAVDERLVLSGRTDCEFEVDDEVAIADFKTGVGKLERVAGTDFYDWQMRIYLWALAKRFPHQKRYRAILLHTREGVESKQIDLKPEDIKKFETDLRTEALNFHAFLQRFAWGDVKHGEELNRALIGECRRRKKACPWHG